MQGKTPPTPAEVAERAYYIWDRAGRPRGQDLAHWLRAEAELAAEAGPRKSRARSRKAAPKQAAAKTEPARAKPKKGAKGAKGAKAAPSTTTRKTRARRPRPEA